jgi:prepilin-type N-terminal cleavage/methylation domain-containing protein
MKRRAFTLIEILVVIGILVLLAGILVPVVTKAMRASKRTKTAADLAVIQTALVAYKNDHGDIPRVYIQTQPAGFQNTVDRPNPPTGAQILCRALMGLAPATDLSSYPTTTVVINGQSVVLPLVNVKQDGKDGPGFRLRTGGKPFGPYLAVEKFKVGYVGDPPPTDEPLLQVLLDGEGAPILYFPASPAQLNHAKVSFRTKLTTYIRRSLAAEVEECTYDAADNFEAFRRTGEADPAVLSRIQVAFGDTDADGGLMTSGEVARYTEPYVLWAAGPDGRFGPDADMAASDGTLDQADVDRMDDVTLGGGK